MYRIAGNFRWCKFSHKLEISLKIPKFKFSNISWPCVYNREAQGILSQFLFHTKGMFSNYAKICTIRKFPAIRYIMYPNYFYITQVTRLSIFLGQKQITVENLC